MLVPGVALSQEQDLALVELDEVHTGPPLLLSVSLWVTSLPSSVSHTTQLRVIVTDEGALDPAVHVTDKAETEPVPKLTPEIITSYWIPLGHQAVDHNSSSVAIQPIPCPPGSPSIKSMPAQFRDKDLMLG
ncbi:hypothetical protein HGM15179_002539 [Zosterops borbonicus]|uniref:Uncharacterized protein n=1 Tax=Zosterops borbonicus TaxID=364589 RepID=A0A8K1GV17_9PASS|nr:hypothetical protein HGM15179_002539 [Zosterops borbonicus]